MALARTLSARLAAALALALLAAAPVHAASIGISPLFRLCQPGSCDPLTVQITLGLAELDADSFAFDIHVSDASLIGLAIGPVPGNPIPGFSGFVDLLGDGTTLRGQLDSVPNSFDGPGVYDIATIPLSPFGQGTVELRFVSAEIACCNGGTIFANGNSSNQLLATVQVVPEPGSFGLLALGLTAVAAARRRAPRRKGGIQ